MTLNIAEFITNSIKLQASIQHLKNVNVKTVKTQMIPKSVSSIILNEYGEKYLLDSNYVSFFWGNITKDIIKSLFNVVDKALGKSANKMTDKDFKKIDIQLDDQQNTVDDSSSIDDSNENIDIDIDDENEESDVELDDNIDTEDEDNISDDEDNDKETLNEDDELTSNKTSYFFLKITTK